MTSRSHIQGIVALIFTVIAATSAMRGQSGDIRLSSDRWQPVLPAEVQIQSGAQSGEWTLAVFGTTEWQGDSIVPVLVMQLLKDTVLSGPQQKLSSPEARPSGYVQVVAADERFLVFWNDRRGGDSGIWMRTVDREGRLGPERKYSDWPFPEQGAMAVHAGGATRLIWNDTSAGGGILLQEIDSAGYPSNSWSFLDSGRASGVMGPFANGVSAVLRVNDTPILLDSAGSRIGKGVWEKKFEERWHLSRDGAVTTVRGDSTLVLYRNILDTVPERVISFILPTVEDARIAPNSVCPYQDENGELALLYVRGGGRGKAVSACLIKTIINIDGGIGKTEHWPKACAGAANGDIGYVSISLSTTEHILWDGFCRMLFVPCSVTYYGKGTQHYNDKYYYVINGQYPKMVYPSDILIYQKQCLNTPHYERVTSPTLSANRLLRVIEVQIRDKKIILYAKAVLAKINILEETPGLALKNNNILVGWISKGADTSADFVQWKRSMDTSISSQPLLTMEPIIGITMMQGVNRFMTASTHQWIESTPNGDSIRRRCDLYSLST